MDDVVHALIMAFSILVFVMGLTVAVYMFSKVTNTAETLLYYNDDTNYYEGIQLYKSSQVVLDKNTDQVISEMTRFVDVETIIPTLYRYYKENFCVKIYDASGDMIQYFDVNTEAAVRNAAGAQKPTAKQKALNKVYNDKNSNLYMFEAPWIGSTDENTKKRVDYFVNGKSGYINNTHVDYTNNKFYKIREFNRTAASSNDKVYFIEQFANYTYTGDTYTDEETGDILVDGAKPEDKMIIIYTATKDV